ncbi:hypothetical protein [Streptomyces sp. NPDC058412]|uniref:hypothetical protein n=1 Tax=Streptomyces sp. NPDC058412 TaxID=3346486 RepID=UPI00364ACD80
MHSDGKRTVDEIVAAARQEGLHFTATSDNNNTSCTGVTWRGNVPTDLLVLNVEEVTTRRRIGGLGRYGPADQGVFDGHVRRVHSLGGLPIAAVGNSDAHTGVGWHASCRGRRRPAGASRG